ncbi:MAG: oxidoreductase, partial [Anaerolineae bacterium]|nr:oxidoreductase [Anaerolineae bacterium]NIN94511.1 oxidoreductase [Anaerolineae bacterium]NIQ77582.1 oxidoreductase [Anaerolineae bacterium]
MKSVRICLVGAGRAGMVHAFNFRYRIADAQLVAMVDANEAMAQERANELDV